MSECRVAGDLGVALSADLRECRGDEEAARRLHPDRDPLAATRARARSRSYRQRLPRAAQGRLPEDAAAVLERAGAAREAVHAAQASELQAVAAWAALHPSPAETDPSCGGERGIAVAGEGAPEVAEFCLAELGLRLRVSTDSARLLLGDAVELAHRLPRCWQALCAGGVPVFRARRVAQATRDLNPDAAAYVDAQVAPLLHVVGVKALDGIVQTAIWRHDLPRALADAQAALDRRGFRIELDTLPGSSSTVQVYGDLDRADALELEAVVADLAHRLLLAGSTETLDVRRSQALGMLARGEQPAAPPDPAAEEWDDPAPAPATAPGPVRRRRDVVLHVHLSEAALRSCPSGVGTATLEGHDVPVSLAQVQAWCAAPGSTTRVVVRPVIDLATTVSADGYQVPDRIAEQVVLRDRTCVFPHCTRDARRSDLDHIEPWARSHDTSTDNIAALCRRHHRLKTHHPGWTYRMLHPGTYLWISPHGRQVLRDPAGTHLL